MLTLCLQKIHSPNHAGCLDWVKCEGTSFLNKGTKSETSFAALWNQFMCITCVVPKAILLHFAESSTTGKLSPVLSGAMHTSVQAALCFTQSLDLLIFECTVIEIGNSPDFWRPSRKHSFKLEKELPHMPYTALWIIAPHHNFLSFFCSSSSSHFGSFISIVGFSKRECAIVSDNIAQSHIKHNNILKTLALCYNMGNTEPECYPYPEPEMV